MSHDARPSQGGREYECASQSSCSVHGKMPLHVGAIYHLVLLVLKAFERASNSI